MAANVLVLNRSNIQAMLTGPGGMVAKDTLRRTLKVAAQAKRNCPVQTGRLRNSIRYTLEPRAGGVVGVVGSDVSYAAFVEDGTRFMTARHFLLNALAAAKD